MKATAISIIVAVIILAMAVAGRFDAQQEEAELQEYCYMTKLWNAEAARGIIPENRRGWPEFKDEGVCDGVLY